MPFTMMESSVRWLELVLVLVLVLGQAWSSPISYPDSRPLTDLGQRLVSHSSLLEPRSQDPRLPIPTPQDIEAIKKVAQILVMLGEQLNKRNHEEVEILNSIVDTLRTLTPKTALLKHKYVIPAIMSDSGAPHTNSPPAAEEIPNDPVETQLI